MMKTHCAIWLGLLTTLAGLQAENWPGFRGPTGQGDSSETGLPLQWSATSNVAWKVEVPGEGWSSPIVWNDQVFVTTTTDGGFSCRLLCLNRTDGKTRWDREVLQQKPRRKESKNTYATPTPVTDGERVYAVFGDGSLVAVTLEGALVWTNREANYYSRHGLGTSPILHESLLIMSFDGSTPVEPGGKVTDTERTGWQIPWDRSYLVALDKRTGREVWRAKRGLSRIGHVTPMVWRGPDHAELISAAGDVIQGFDLKTGARLWNMYSKGEGVVPSVVLGEGLVFAASGFEAPTIRAVKPGGQGDVLGSHLVWEQKKGVPTLASFAYVKPYLYAVTDGGVVSCLQAATGEIVWQERIGGSYSSSPVAAEGHLYFLSESGDTTVLAAAPRFQVLAKNSIGERCQASMAVSHQQLFIRTDKSLFCLGLGAGR